MCLFDQLIHGAYHEGEDQARIYRLDQLFFLSSFHQFIEGGRKLLRLLPRVGSDKRRMIALLQENDFFEISQLVA